MKQIFLSPVKVVEHIELEENRGRLRGITEDGVTPELMDALYDDVVQEDPNEDDLFSDKEYENNHRKAEIEVIKKNTDNLPQYDFNSSYMMTLKEASLNTEIKTPFAILKGKDKKSKANFNDTIYKLDKKIQFNEQRKAVRVGFIEGADTFKLARYNLSKPKALVGIAHEKYPIRRKKRFNHKKVGQIPLTSSTHLVDYYVEVTKSRGLLWIIWMAVLALIIATLLESTPMEGWKFSWDNLTVFKTSISEVQEESQLSINHKSEVQLVGGSMDLGLVITKAAGSENLQCKIKIYSEDNLIYESDLIEAEGSLGEIQLQGLADWETGNKTCAVICEVYKETGGMLGILESQFILKV